MSHLSFLSLAILIGCSSRVCAQAPAGKDAAPPAKKESAAAPAPAAEPSRAAVEKFVTDLKALIASREKSVTRLINEITAQDQAIQEAVEKVLQILTTAKDSVETRSKVTQMKQETMAALKRAAQAYAQKRALIAEELRATKNEYRREDLFDSRGQIDTRIDKMVDAMLKLALSMETDEGHERYIQDSSGVMVGGRYGIAVPTTKRNPEFDQNKRQVAKTEKVSGEIGKAFDLSLKRLDTQEQDLAAKLAKPGISEEEKERLGAEILRIQAIREERLQQQALFASGPHSEAQSELDRKGAIETEEIVEGITAGARRDFTRMMAAFNELKTERQALATLKAKLDHAVKWLETHPDAK
jgi:hypothetical protein